MRWRRGGALPSSCRRRARKMTDHLSAARGVACRMGVSASVTRVDNSSAWCDVFRACRDGDSEALDAQLRTSPRGALAVDGTGATALMWAAACG